MKILFDARVVPHCGIGSYVRNLVSGLQKMGTGDEFIMGPSEDVGLDWVSGVKRIYGAAHRLYWENFLLPRILQRGCFDLLHNVRNIGVPLHAPCPVILTLHDVIPKVYQKEYLPSWKEQLMYPNLVAHAVDKADIIITDSAFSAQDIVKFFPKAKRKIEVVLLAGDPAFKQIQYPEKLYDFPYILTIGGSEYRKNVFRLLRAFLSVPVSVRHGVKLVVVGGSWRGCDIQKEYPSAKYPEIVYPGFVSEEKLIHLYNEAILFALPSLYEGFGLPILEAMNCGTPVLCANTSSIPEVAGEAAVLVDPYSEDEMAEAICRVLSNISLREELCEKGLEQCKKFTWEKTAAQTYQIYRHLAK